MLRHIAVLAPLPALLASTLLAAPPASPAPPAAASGTLVVLNKAEGSASLIDLASGKAVATLPTGEGPHEAAVSPDGRRALATNYGVRGKPGATLSLIDVAQAQVVKTIDLGTYKRPHGVEWLDDRRAVVTCEENQALVVVDVDSGRVDGSVATGERVSHMVAVTPDGKLAFVANIGSGSVTAVDLAGMKVLAQIPTGAGAEGIAITPDGREVWVTNREAGTLSVVSAATREVTASLPAPGFPIRVQISEDGRHALVSLARAGEVAVFDVPGRIELRRVPFKLAAATTEGRLFTGFGASPVPIGIVLPPGSRRAYVANANADAVAVLDLDSWSVTGALQAGREPDGMAWSPLRVERRE